MNKVIQEHNNACDTFAARIAEAKRRLEADEVANTCDEFKGLLTLVDDAQKSFDHAEMLTTQIRVKIVQIEREIVEHRKPAEELNEDLNKYLGHPEFHLEIKDTGYTVTRNGVPARSLSEGETTAIALLYFLRSLTDRRFDLTNGVVVLDDPVSSLDANALFLAFGFIREGTEKAGQIFIFIHNFTFFRQVRNWFHHLKRQNKTEISQRPARFYMLDSTLDRDKRYAKIRTLDPLLEKYESEYHFLFARIYREAKASSQASFEKNYILPNMARRLLETFLAFRQPEVFGHLWQKMQNVKFDGTKKVRILRFLHTYSHADTIGINEHDPSLLGEAHSVLKDLLDFIKDQDPGHFEAMVKLVNGHGDEGIQERPSHA